MIYHSIRSYFCDLKGWVSSLIPIPFTDHLTLEELKSQTGLEVENHHSEFATAMEPINISSSDSELDMEDSTEVEILGMTGPARSRVLPSRASIGNGRQSREVPSPKRSPAFNGTSSNAYNHSPSKLQCHPGSSADARALNTQIAKVDDSRHVKDNGNVGHLRTFVPPIYNAWFEGHEELSSHEALKRTLPPYMNNHQIHDTYGNSFHLSGSNSKGSMRDHVDRVDDNDIIMYENHGSSRVLPPSLVASSSDHAYNSGVGPDGVAESDERLIYQAVVEDLNQPKVEATLPDGLLSVSLLRHQKIALAWMLQKETKSCHCLGGILADDQGLGKTISMIALIQMERSLQKKAKSEDLSNDKAEPLNLDDDDDDHNKGGQSLEIVKQNGESDNLKLKSEASTSTRQFNSRRPSAGTLVVCPASVLRQWARELDEKVADEAKLSVLIYHGGNRTKDHVELAKYDVVLTTYSIVTNEVPKQPLVDEDEADEKNGAKHEFSTTRKRKNISTTSKKTKKGRKGKDTSTIEYDCGALARVSWLRVILDEAQTIKNHRTQVSRACCSLRAKRRWCLSGTPIQNTIDDLYSYFRFLRYDPYAKYKAFISGIKNLISRNSVQGYMKLQVVLRACMLRRTKGTLIDGVPIIQLPPKTLHLNKVDFSEEERTFYIKLETDSRSQFKAYAAAGTLNQNYANILLLLLRLRQACDHPLLVKGYNSESVGKASVEMAKRLPRDMIARFLDLLENSSAICCVCFDPPEDPVVTMCGHVFCYQCVSEYLTGDDNTCPVIDCKKQLSTDVVYSKATLISCVSGVLDGELIKSQSVEKPAVMQNDFTSAKISAVLEILQSHLLVNSQSSELPSSSGCNGNSPSIGKTYTHDSKSGASVVVCTTVHSSTPQGPIKTIIFSQWTGMLDLVEREMNRYLIQYRRLDGTMTLSSRDRAVRDFNNDPEVTAMLMSLKAGNLGLNMVAACHVILLDLWWNPSTEEQAIDRAHRIGQTRPVTVTRITVKDTVEDRILALQEEKRKMVASAFGEDQGGSSATRLTVEDLKYLFKF